ncbi:MAG: class I SAM-dependent methyltransferase [Candidatus Dormibacteria bacterium]
MRVRASHGLAGEVLEVGFGSGLNVPHYPAAVSRVLAVEPADVAWRMARRRVARSPVPIDRVGLDGQALALEDASVDHVLMTWTLCTIPDAGAALAEMRRVLRPGGRLHFAEHGLAADPAVARWQHRLTPLQRRLAGGCHLDRPIADLIEAAGLTMVDLQTGYLPGPRPLSHLYEGVAQAPS